MRAPCERLEVLAEPRSKPRAYPRAPCERLEVLADAPPLEAVFDAICEPLAYGRLDAQVLGLPRSEPRAVRGLEGLAYGRLDAQVLASAWRASLTCAGPSDRLRGHPHFGSLDRSVVFAVDDCSRAKRVIEGRQHLTAITMAQLCSPALPFC